MLNNNKTETFRWIAFYHSYNEGRGILGSVEKKIDDKSLDDWLTVSTARIGGLNIPLNKELDENKRIYLKTVEYLQEVDDCGNVSVIEERLVNLEVQ